MTSDCFDELESLLLDWEDGILDESGIERLRELLKDNEARAHYVRIQMMSAAMKLDGDAGLIPPRGVEVAVTSSTRKPTMAHSSSDVAANKNRQRWVLTVAVLLICGLAGRLIQLEWTDGPGNSIGEISGGDLRDKSEEATSQGVALVTRLVDVTLEEGQSKLETGEALAPGRLAIASGYVQIEFFCGATVILEGPAELDLQSPLLARVCRGRLRAQVPPAARGFSLEVDDMKVVDLGTEFGLSVTEEGSSVQVFDGEVELHRPAKEKRLLKAGQALLRKADGAFAEAAVTPERFLDIATLETHSRGQQAARYQRWKAWSGELRRDSRLIAYYAFDNHGDWKRRLPCDLEPPDTELDGAIVGARQAEGRWVAKRALEFKQPGDRVRVQISGEFGSLTFACWAKIDSLDRWYNSLFLTDGYNRGEPHWQILDTGQLYFSVRPTELGMQGPRDHKALSPVFWKPSLSGRWLHLATVYDVEARSITHYLNGQVLSSETVAREQLVAETRIGTASIGNWSMPTRPDSSFSVRNLNGSIDEFILFAEALAGDEILEIYENGKP